MGKYITILTILILPLALKAQRAASDTIVTVEFSVFGVGLDSFEDLLFFDGEKYVELHFNKTSRSTEVYAYRGPQVIRIVTPNPAYPGPSNDEPMYLEVTQVSAVTSIQNALLVFAADKQNRQVAKEKRKYRAFLIDDSPTSFPANSITIINATSVDLYGQVANERFQFPTNSTKLISYENFARDDEAVPIAFAFDAPDGPMLTMSNTIPLPRDRRVVLILMNPRREGSIRINLRSLIDVLPNVSDSEE